MAFPPSLRPSTLIPFSSTKKLGVMISFLTSEGERTSRRGGFFHSLPPSAALSLSPLHSVPFIHIQQSIMFRKKKREREAEGEGEIRRLQMEVVFFFSCSYPSAFEPAMWKSARSTALHSSLPLIKSCQSGLNQHAKCHSTL